MYTFFRIKQNCLSRNEYETPETLGTDRIAAVAGAYYLFPGRNVLIIDAGKCGHI